MDISKKELLLIFLNNLHNNKYDYGLIDFKGVKNLDEKVSIICPKHGVFFQKLIKHKLGHNCPKCNGRGLSFEEKVEILNKAHNYKYSYYNNIEIKCAKDYIIVTCPIHGDFKVTYDNHRSGLGCTKCSGKYKYKQAEFINECKTKHSNKYDYSLVEFENFKSKIIVICPIHGEFKMNAKKHLDGGECFKCRYERNGKIQSLNQKLFIEQCNSIHEFKYDYSNVTYYNNHTKIKIICSIHGEFEQSPASHKSGRGCPSCGKLKLANIRLKRISDDRNNGVQVVPNFNPKACEILDNISKNTKTHIRHAMNHIDGEFRVNGTPYHVDGYDEKNNIVYEIYERHHYRKGELRKRDIEREKTIKFLLKCEIIRINP
jgi:hypothetical protein